MENFWVISKENYEDIKHLFDFLNGQAKLLKSLTDGKAFCVFEKEEKTPIESLAKTLQSTIPFFGSEREKTSDLFDNNRYAFKIYSKNKEYFFTLFSFECYDSYPIKMNIDENILSELGTIFTRDINDFSSFLSIYRKIVGSTKVKVLLQKFNKIS